MRLVPSHGFLRLLYTELLKSVHYEQPPLQAGTDPEEEVEPLSPKLKRVYLYIRTFTLKHRVAPARTQIAEHMKISVPTVTWYLRELEKRGWLKLLEGTQRGISLMTGEPLPVLEVQRKLAPDDPLMADENIMEYLPEEIGKLWAPEATYFLRIGDRGGMETPGFQKGDLVGIQATDEPKAGRVAVLTVDGEVVLRVYRGTTKRFIQLATLDSNGKVAENERVDLNKHDVRIEGIVVHKFMAIDLAGFNYLEDPPPDE